MFTDVLRNGSWVFGIFLQKETLLHDDGECQQDERNFREKAWLLESSKRLLEKRAGHILLNSNDTYYLSNACSIPDVVSNNVLQINKMGDCSHIGLVGQFLFSRCG